MFIVNILNVYITLVIVLNKTDTTVSQQYVYNRKREQTRIRLLNLTTLTANISELTGQKRGVTHTLPRNFTHAGPGAAKTCSSQPKRVFWTHFTSQNSQSPGDGFTSVSTAQWQIQQTHDKDLTHFAQGRRLVTWRKGH